MISESVSLQNADPSSSCLSKKKLSPETLALQTCSLAHTHRHTHTLTHTCVHLFVTASRKALGCCVETAGLLFAVKFAAPVSQGQPNRLCCENKNHERKS